MILGDIIKQYRTDHSLSMDEFSKKCGLSKAYISILERNRNPVNNKEVVPSLETIKAVAAAVGIDFNVIIAMLDGDQPVQIDSANIPPGFEPMPAMKRVPLIGHIACGDPITAEENIEGYISVPDEWNATFTLMCEGDSMAPRIQDGDVVAIRKQDTVENGQIAAVRIDNEATLKHVYVYPDYIELRPENPSFESIIKIGPAMNEVYIEGLAVGICRGIS